MTGRLDKDKAVRFISKLVQLTTEKKIQWQSVDADGQMAFQGEVEDRIIRLYRYSREVPNPAYEAYVNPLSATSVVFNTSTLFNRGEPPKTVVVSGTVLEFLDRYTRHAIYRIENVAGLSDLYEAVSYTTAGVEELVDAILLKE